jgi:hypothetical protein
MVLAHEKSKVKEGLPLHGGSRKKTPGPAPKVALHSGLSPSLFIHVVVYCIAKMSLLGEL